MENDKIQKPKGFVELMWWLFVDTIALKDFSDNIGQNNKQKIRYIFKPFIISSLFFIGAWLLLLFLLIVVDWPAFIGNHLPVNDESFMKMDNYFDKFSWLFFRSAGSFSSVLNSLPSVALMMWFFFGLRFYTSRLKKVSNLIFDELLATGIVSLIMLIGLYLDGSFVCFFSINVFLFVLYFSFNSYKLILSFYIDIGIASVIVSGLSSFVPVCWEKLLLCYILFFILFSFLTLSLLQSVFYTVKSVRGKYGLEWNPHWWDYDLVFPVFGLKNRLIDETLQSPRKAMPLIEHMFLTGQNLNKDLLYSLVHAYVSGMWKANRLAVKEFADNYPSVSIQGEYLPTKKWYVIHQEASRARYDSSIENNIHTRLKYFDIFREKLNEFRQQNLLENPKWNKYYFETLDLWVKSANEEYERLKLEAENQEPIAANIYRGGERLNPQFDQQLFFGRNDLRNDFKNKVLTATSMPLFFIQGQRRVGKSSLIHFLPGFLDSGFKLIFIDLQAGVTSVEEWFEVMQNKIAKELKQEFSIDEKEEKKTWLELWKTFAHDLENMAEKDGRKIILAIDEYEELHKCLQAEPEQAGQLLGAMRSFSQSQNRVVFLFAGADFFTELKNPNWNEYFVQTVPLRVDYLNREDSFKLIQVVPLRYPESLLEKMYFDTQGHPCLLQKICQEIVNIANADGRKDMTEADYEKALNKVIRLPQNGVVDVFWGQFCELRELKDTVLEILDGKTPSDSRKAKILKVHGFIVEENGRWKMRVPMFEEWVREFGDL